MLSQMTEHKYVHTDVAASSRLERYFATLLSSPLQAASSAILRRCCRCRLKRHFATLLSPPRARFLDAAVAAASSAISRRYFRRRLECGLFFWVFSKILVSFAV
jgi:hypothetical protein